LLSFTGGINIVFGFAEQSLENIYTKKGDELIIRDVWGAITYNRKGIFIAGGAGVTPFISIFRDLQTKNETAGNKLLFANKTVADIIYKDEFRKMLGDDFINILSDEKAEGYTYGMIDEEFLKANISDFNTKLYVCDPPPMIDAVMKELKNLGADKNSITVEL